MKLWAVIGNLTRVATTLFWAEDIGGTPQSTDASGGRLGATGRSVTDGPRKGVVGALESRDAPTGEHHHVRLSLYA